MKNKYIFHLSTTYLLMLINIVIPILIIPFMTSNLGHEKYGLWVLLSSIMIYFNLGSLGFGNTLIRALSKTDIIETINKHISTMLVFLLIMVLVLCGIFFVVLMNFTHIFEITPNIMHVAKITFIIVFITFVINFITNIFYALLFAKGMIHISNAIGIFQAISTAILLFITLYFGYSLIGIALVYFTVSFFVGIMVYFIAKSKIKFQISIRYFDKKTLKEMSVPSIHYFLLSLSSMIIMYSDNITISSFLSVSAVAAYAIAYKLIDVSQKLLFKLSDILLPDVAKLYEDGDYQSILLMHNKVLLISVFFSLLGYGILFFWGIDIIRLWVGNEFTITENIFMIFIIYGIWHTWVHVSAIFIVAMGIHKETSYMGLFEAMLNILLSIVLLHYYGLLGVALGTLIAHLLTNGWFVNYWFYKSIKYKINMENGIAS